MDCYWVGAVPKVYPGSGLSSLALYLGGSDFGKSGWLEPSKKPMTLHRMPLGFRV